MKTVNYLTNQFSKKLKKRKNKKTSLVKLQTGNLTSNQNKFAEKRNI